MINAIKGNNHFAIRSTGISNLSADVIFQRIARTLVCYGHIKASGDRRTGWRAENLSVRIGVLTTTIVNALEIYKYRVFCIAAFLIHVEDKTLGCLT